MFDITKLEDALKGVRDFFLQTELAYKCIFEKNEALARERDDLKTRVWELEGKLNEALTLGHRAQAELKTALETIEEYEALKQRGCGTT